MEIKIIPFLFKTRTAFILLKGDKIHFLSTLNNNSLSLNQNTNQFLLLVKIELQISYSTIRNFIN